jgi:hypothetical protein
MQRRLSQLLFVFASLALAAGAPAAIVTPDELHLGVRAPGEVVEASVWLINTGDAPLEVLEARATCGCTSLAGFAPRTLAPRTAVEVPIRITAPKQPGQAKAISVTFTIRDGNPIRVPIRIATEGAPAPGGALTVSPPELDLGRVTAATRAQSSIHLTNPGDAPVRVTAAKAGCGCITFPGFAPFDLGPGASADVRLSMKAPATVGGSKVKDVTFTVEGHRPVKVPVRLETVHPSVEALKQHLVRTEAGAAGPRYGDFRVEGDVVSAIVWSADAAPGARLVCRLDKDGHICSLRVEPITPT